MKIVKSLPVLICLQVFLTAKANPLSKVFELLGGLVEEVVADGEKEDKAYGSFVKWCSENTQNLGFEIKSATSEKAKLEAKIDELISDGDVATSKIEELAGAISSSEAELKKASSIREKEVSEFAAGEKELMETIDALDRASSILEKEMAKSGSAALAQVNTRSMTTLIQTIGTVAQAKPLGRKPRIACLHGGGGNEFIFRSQLAPLIKRLGDEVELVFLEGKHLSDEVRFDERGKKTIETLRAVFGADQALREHAVTKYGELGDAGAKQF